MDWRNNPGFLDPLSWTPPLSLLFIRPILISTQDCLEEIVGRRVLWWLVIFWFWVPGWFLTPLTATASDPADELLRFKRLHGHLLYADAFYLHGSVCRRSVGISFCLSIYLFMSHSFEVETTTCQEIAHLPHALEGSFPWVKPVPVNLRYLSWKLTWTPGYSAWRFLCSHLLVPPPLHTTCLLENL